MAFEDYDRYARRIDRWEGVAVQQRTAVRSAGHIIDFAFDWPDAVYAVSDRHRPAVEMNSVLFYETPSKVSNWTLRLPSVPQADNPQEPVEGRMQADLLDERHCPRELSMVLVERDDVWTPHIQPWGKSDIEEDPDEVLDIIYNIWSNYRGLVVPDGRLV